MTLEEFRVFEKEQLGNTEGNMIICSRSRKGKAELLTEDEVKSLEDMAMFFLDKKGGVR